MLRKVLALAVLLGGSSSAFAASTVPATITQQGRLLNSLGVPVAGSQSLTFSLYTMATGGGAIWTETQTVTFDDGYFSIQLGSMMSFPSTLWDGTTRFLGVKVGSDSEMTPREEITSVPYAMVAQNAIGDITPKSITVNGTLIVKPDGSLAIGTGSVGPTGPSGPSGPSGPVGAASTVAGPTGPQGPSGPQGIAGPSGPQGPGGPSGPQGIQGPSGPQGIAGPSGPQGPQGNASTVPGPSGPQGIPGPSGPQGAASTVAGPSGPQGIAGPSGPSGPAGPASVVTGGSSSFGTSTTGYSFPSSGVLFNQSVGGGHCIVMATINVSTTLTGNTYSYPAYRLNGTSTQDIGQFAWTSQTSPSPSGSSTSHGYFTLTPGGKYDFGCYTGFQGPTSVSCMVTFLCH